MLLYFSNGPLLGGFTMRARLFSDGSQLLFVTIVEESPVKV